MNPGHKPKNPKAKRLAPPPRRLMQSQPGWHVHTSTMAPIAPIERDIFDDDDEEGWQDMPVEREDTSASGLDEEDIKKYHYTAPSSTSKKTAANATGNLIDFDDHGQEWRSKSDQNESEYTRLRLMEEDDTDEVHLRTRYLFDEDKAMTPLSQMQATKGLLTESQRIAYVGLCALVTKEMAANLRRIDRSIVKASAQNMDLWAIKIMGRLFYHMEIATDEQKMIESLAMHGVQPMDLVPSLMTTHTVSNPEYDPVEARRQAEEAYHRAEAEEDDISTPSTASIPTSPLPPTTPTAQSFRTTPRILDDTVQPSMPGVSTSLSSADEKVTLDIRWTVLCDLFLILIADSVYDSRSRVLLETVARKLGLGWLDVVRFESRVTEALEIQEGVERMEAQDLVDGRQKAARKKRYMMMGLATLGGGLVIGLSAGLLAPVIGAGLGAAFTAVGVSGTSAFLGGTAGAAVITTGGVLTGSGIAGRSMAKRTQQVRTFDLLPLHNSKRVSCILTVPGFLNGPLDDPRLPFSVLDPIVGDVFSVLWEPEMIRETGSALKILTSEVLSQVGQTVLQATVMTAFMTALQWPIILTKLSYLIDNPWNNALDRARAAGYVLADVLMQRHLGVRPITLVGFSLGARVIFYALLELAKNKAYGIVQDVILLGTTLSVGTKVWCEAATVVSGRFINGFARNDWVLNYLFRATSGGVGTVAGLSPVQGVPGLENVDVTDKIAGHMSYRSFLPLILDELGFPVFSDHFDEPVEPDFQEDRIVVREGEEKEKKGWFSRKKKKKSPTSSASVSRPPSTSSWSSPRKSTSSSTSSTTASENGDDDLPPREEDKAGKSAADAIPIHAGFDLTAMKEMIEQAKLETSEKQASASAPAPVALSQPLPPPLSPSSLPRSESAPPVAGSPDRTPVMSPARLPAAASPTGVDDMTNSMGDSLSLQDQRPGQGSVTSLPYSLARLHSDPFPSKVGPITVNPFGPEEDGNKDDEDEDEDEEGGNLPSWARPMSFVTPALSSSSRLSFQRSSSPYDMGGSGGPPAQDSVPTLSFGQPDGSIVFGNDPWRQQDSPDKQGSAANDRNPWG